LDDGTHIIHPHRYAQLDETNIKEGGEIKIFIPAHRNFRVIAIAAPVPPYPGYPLDPPFRSRFQARFVDPVGSLMALGSTVATSTNPISSSTLEKLRDIVLSTQYASESRHSLEAVSKSTLPPFPQTALVKLYSIVSKFPPPAQLSPEQLARLFLIIHPGLIHAPFQAWAMLSRQTEEAGLGELGSPSMAGADERIGVFGYRVVSIERRDEQSAFVSFTGSPPLPPVTFVVPAGPKPLRPFPFTGKVEFHTTERFMGLLTCFLQAHVLGWDISFIPPVLPSTASSSTSTLVKVFGQILGYETEVVHMYKELGGRELIMRREIEDGGATTWKPSPLIEGAWKGRLVHLAGIDVIGATSGSLARLIQDRETELWEGKRIVSEASVEEVSCKLFLCSTWLSDACLDRFWRVIGCSSVV
jgi:von Willebrand factor A domain-containing protein 8